MLAYSAVFYRLLGLLAFISLVLSYVLTYGTLVFLGYTVDYSLDLAGIAGLVIGIGMTADSYVVFFERIKDELRDGHRFRSAVPRAWKSASRTIVTGNMVSLIGAVVLYLLATGEVRGFAFTLGLTTLTDILVAFTVTWPLVYLASTKDLFSKTWANGMGRMANLQAEAAERRRIERRKQQAAEQSRERGVTATITGPGSGPTTSPTPESTNRPATDEEGR